MLFRSHFVSIGYIRDDKMADFVNSLMGSTMSGVTGGAEGMDLGLDNMSGTLTVDKDFNMLSQKVKMDMTMSMEGQEVKASIDADMTVNNPGQEVTVELQAD